MPRGDPDYIKMLQQAAVPQQAIQYHGYQGNISVGWQKAEGNSVDTTKVIIALAERLGLTIDHKSELVETRPGKAWGGDSFTPTNFAKVREDLDDIQEIVMGVAKYLEVEVTVEDGRKVTVTPPPPEETDVESQGNDRDPF